MVRKRYITIHCSATKNNKKVSVEEITRWHKKRGFRTIGYHCVIQPDGKIEDGRPLNQTGAHVKGYNRIDGIINLGVCMIGDTKFTYEQFDSLRRWIDGVRMTYIVDPWDISGHYSYTTRKSCPNMKIERLFAWYFLEDVKAIEPYLIKKKKPWKL